MGLTALVTLLYLFFNKNKNNKYIYIRETETALKSFEKITVTFLKQAVVNTLWL